MIFIATTTIYTFAGAGAPLSLISTRQLLINKNQSPCQWTWCANYKKKIITIIIIIIIIIIVIIMIIFDNAPLTPIMFESDRCFMVHIQSNNLNVFSCSKYLILRVPALACLANNSLKYRGEHHSMHLEVKSRISNSIIFLIGSQ